MKTFSISVIIFCCALAISLNPGLAQNNSSSAVGRVTFVKGIVTRTSAEARESLKAGQLIAANDTLVTETGAKVKLFLNEKNLLVTILPNTKALITPEGVELVEGSEINIIEKKLDFLQPEPELDERSSQMGGAYVLRAPPPSLEPQNLKNTFCLDTRPTFRWKCSKQGKFQITLYATTSDNLKKVFWKRQTSVNSLVYPEEESSLNQGMVYSWEILELATDSKRDHYSTQFYVLSENEREAFFSELTQLKQLSENEGSEDVTKDFLKIELLNKYHLRDDLKQLLADLLVKHPDNEEVKRIIKEF